MTSYAEELARDIRAGLSSGQKQIPSKYFYDERGSRLFEEICRLPEYYPTRTEMAILEEHAGAIMEPFTAGDLVEMGSGANWKICRLLDAAAQPHGAGIRYVPLDVSESALQAAAEELIRMYGGLEVLGIVADFTRNLDRIPDDADRLITLFGGTIGNFTDAEAAELLEGVSALMRRGDRFLIGMDTVKDTDLLEAAYNDARGITAAFNKNVLNVVNRELCATFDLDLFDHVAFYNETSDQIEMHLAARQAMAVEIAALDMVVEFENGETIHTEISRKFSRERAIRIFEDAGLAPQRWFTDENGWFSLVELVRR
ncbi:L-histidine N(alpha)-methyltransferase [Methanoculleus sp. FWC-SCC1]|uniref:L-histidine N(Alpha)-methyltransferase n=2 Tax=Methanoculleus frigidifontis TaxID=2584085 RepID=A0ABT8MBJ1_9EURY|nr:L-histidine N(alpha)-methyltransferase [Methanoculleus sp. FWC-SCC1]